MAGVNARIRYKSILRNDAFLFISTLIFTSAKEDIIIVVCLFLCLFVCRLATLCKNVRTDFRDIFRKCWQWANSQTIKFWWRSGSRPDADQIRIRIRIATLVRRALAEVCTVPVL